MSQTVKFYRISQTSFNTDSSRTYKKGDIYFIFNNDTDHTGMLYVCTQNGNKSTAHFEQYSSGKSMLFICEYGVTTVDEITEALEDGKIPICWYNNRLYVYATNTGTYIYFGSIYGVVTSYIRVTISNEAWTSSSASLLTIDKIDKSTTPISASSTDTQVPSAKNVYNAIQAIPIPESDLFVCEYGTTTSTELQAAIDAGKIPVCWYQYSGNDILYKYTYKNGNNYWFSAISAYQEYSMYLNSTNDSWVNRGLLSHQSVANKTTSLSSASTDTQYPSAKCVYEHTRDILVDVTDQIEDLRSNKQNKLIAGDGIELTDLIDSTRISCTGGGGHDTTKEDVSNKIQTGTLTASTTQYPSSSVVKTVTDDLQTQITNISTIGRFLSVWDCATGLPYTDPETSPYLYKTGDYYIVGNIILKNYENIVFNSNEYKFASIVGEFRRYLRVNGGPETTNYTIFVYNDTVVSVGDEVHSGPSAGATVIGTVSEVKTIQQLIPSGSQYISGQPSTAVLETGSSIAVNDIFRYDGTVWQLFNLKQTTTTIDNIAGLRSELDNRVLCNTTDTQYINTNIINTGNITSLSVTVGTNDSSGSLNILDSTSIRRVGAGHMPIDFLANSTGQSTTITMSQKAITDAIGDVASLLAAL